MSKKEKREGSTPAEALAEAFKIREKKEEPPVRPGPDAS